MALPSSLTHNGSPVVTPPGTPAATTHGCGGSCITVTPMGYARPTTYPGGINPNAGRRTRRYRMLRANYRAQCAHWQNPDGTTGLPCWLCGKPIDYSLPAGPNGHPEAWNLDHAHPVSTHPELAEDPANFRPSHADCNERRGDQAPFIELGTPSEDW